MTAPAKVSSAQIFERFDEIQNTQGLDYKQAPLLVYKPNKGKGAALKLECNLLPTFSEPDEEGRQWLRKPTGGIFLEIASEIPSEGENAAFAWKETVTAKLSPPDVLAFLLAYREVREFKRKVPNEIRAIVKNGDKYEKEETGLVMGRIHKFDNETTIIDWTFEESRSIVRLVKIKAKEKRSISLSLTEEYSFIHYLKNTLTAIHRAGLR